MGAISKLATFAAKEAIKAAEDKAPSFAVKAADVAKNMVSPSEQVPWFMSDGPFKIINKQTGKTVGTAKTRSGATLSLDRNDNKWGAYVHRIVGPPRTYSDAAEDAVEGAIETVAKARGGRVSPFKVKR